MNWTDRADALLVALWEQGLTLNGVAKGMQEAGFGVNKNMVAGRKHMLRARGVQISRRASPLSLRRNGDTYVEPSSQGVEHDQGVDYLENRGCKALLDKVGSHGLPMCCGRKRLDGMSYCQTHHDAFSNIGIRK